MSLVIYNSSKIHLLSLFIDNSSNIYLLFKITNQSLTGCIMETCNTVDHTAEDYLHTDIPTCNTKKPQQKYRIGTLRLL